MHKSELPKTIVCWKRFGVSKELFIPNGVGAGCTAGSRSDVCSGDLVPSGSVSGDFGGDFFANSSAFLLSSSSLIRFSRSRISYCNVSTIQEFQVHIFQHSLLSNSSSIIAFHPSMFGDCVCHYLLELLTTFVNYINHVMLIFISVVT